MRIEGLQYDSPNTFTPWQRMQLALLPPAIGISLRLLLRSCRFEVRHRAYFDDTLAQHGQVLCPFWHETMALVAWVQRDLGGHTLTSYSFDGELAARIVPWFNIEAIRGSSSRGGPAALDDLTSALAKTRIIGWTLDGPRGPRRQAKPGIAALAARSGCPIVPAGLAVSHCLRLSSWDRFPIPRPFARILYDYAPPIPPPPDTSKEAIAATRLEVEQALNTLHQNLERELGVEEAALLEAPPEREDN